MADHPLSPGGFSLAVLDACALLPPRLSDVLFDLVLEGLYLPHWTAEIEDEFLRNFQAVTGAVTAGGGARRLGAFRAAARRRHEIFGHMDPSAIAKVPAAVDKKDVHVASAALMLARSAEADVDKVFLVTANLEDLPPDALASQGVVTLSPGAFVDALHGRPRTRAARVDPHACRPQESSVHGRRVVGGVGPPRRIRHGQVLVESLGCRTGQGAQVHALRLG